VVPASCFESFDIRELRELAEAWAVHELSRVAVLSAAMTAPFPLENQRNPSPVKTLTRFALPLLAYLASGCGLTDPDIPEIAGKWTGTDNDGDRWELELTENENGGLSGTYALQIVGSLTFRDSVTGRYEYPVVSWDLEISVPGNPVQRCSFRGTMAESGQSFAGTVTCTGGGVADWTSPLDFRRTT